MGLTREEALKILGLEDGCTNRDIRERFKKLALKWHPDKNLHSPDEAQRKFQAISAAYTRLVASEETDDEISTETLGEMFAEIWEMHNRGHHTYDPHAHLFCDCELCQQEWRDVDYTDILGSDSDMDEDLYYGYEDTMYADRLLREFAERLYRNYNGPSRATRRARGTYADRWSSSVYRKKRITAEEASRNAEQLLQAEEEEKKQAEKRRTKNKKKKEAKKRRKAKQQMGSKGGSKDQVRYSGDEGDEEEEEEEEEEEKEWNGEDEEEHSENELDVTSAFIARASKKQQAQQTAKTKNGPSQTGPQAREHREEKSQYELFGSHVSVANGTEKISKNAMVEPKRPVAGTRDEYVTRRAEKQGNLQVPTLNGTSAATFNGPVPVLHATNSAPTSNIPEGASNDPNAAKSRQLAGQGNRAAKDGRFEEAVRKYTEAIELYSFDHRYFGNRSFCYDYLHDYKSALQDANEALQLDPNWPKGYYRKGRALAGLKRYEEAEKAFTIAIQLDPNYTDAQEEFFKIKVEQLESMGFPTELCEVAIKQHKTVQAAVDAILAGNVASSLEVEDAPSSQLSSQNYVPIFNSSGYEIPPRMLTTNPQTPSLPNQGCSLWVGNINSDTVSEEMLCDVFEKCGKIDSIRMLYDRHCTFVNYTRPEEAALALKELQGYHIGGCYLLLRYPDNPKGASGKKVKKSGPVNGDECYFWRTTGCAFGSQCYYLHVPAHEGIDLTEGMLKGAKPQKV